MIKHCIICGNNFKANRKLKTCSDKCRIALAAQRFKKWRDKNIEKDQERVRNYYHNNKEKRNDYNKEWAKKNAEKVIEKSKLRYANNIVKLKKQFKDWYYANQEKQLKRASDYRRNNPDKIKEINKRALSKRYRNNPL